MAKLSDFTPQKKNANKHTEYGGAVLDRSMEEVGWITAITSANDGEVFDGSRRLEKAYEKFGDVEPIVVETDGTRPVIVKRTDIKNAQDPRAIRAGIAANRVAELSLDWDLEVMGDLLGEDDTVLDGLFNDEELIDFGLMEEPEGQDAEPQIDRAAELQEKWGVQVGDLWQLGKNHRLICGDCTDAAVVEKVMGGERADVCVTDPPYNVGKDFKNEKLSDKAFFEFNINWVKEIPRECGIFIACHSPQKFPSLLDAARGKGWRFGRMLWMFKKGTAFGVVPWHGWARRSECIIVFDKENATYPEWVDYHADMYEVEKRVNTTEDTVDEDIVLHPTVKPLWVIQDLINHTVGIVYEPFAGSGTTIIAAENLQRKCRAVEISQEYCSVILQRFSDAFPTQEIKRIE